jgi:YidC/Oxa1 family membrane protein insertase
MMGQEKKLVLFFLIVFLWMIGTSYFSRWMGWTRPPKRPPAVAASKDTDSKRDALTDLGAGKSEPKKGDTASPTGPVKSPAKPEAEAAGTKPSSDAEIELVNPSELVLGSTEHWVPGGYKLRVQLEQKGAGIESVLSAIYDAEFEFGKPRKRPLEFISRDTKAPPTMALTLGEGARAAKFTALASDDSEEADKAALRQAAAESVDLLERELWEVVREGGKAIRSVQGVSPQTNAPVSGQAVVFRITAKSGVVVTKTYRLFPDTDGLEVEIKFESPGQERSTVYHLLGPHGIPIEGLWYTSTFRDVFFAQVGQNKIATYAAGDVVAKEGSVENTTVPLRFAGVENQYFATFVEPVPAPTGQEDRWDSRTVAVTLHKDEKPYQSDVGVQITSRSFKVRPDEPVVHTYRVFAGPKTHQVLEPYGADELASYRKPQWIPFAPDIARVLITPTLGFTYEVTARVARFFGGTKGNYGVAIILLTILVRGLMFPLGRKQARSAQKMQSLQPLLKELQDKYKDDKEKLTKETFALYKRHGVNPVSGCLPALIQLPIFVGLWQALNTSFALRHATFLWIRDLAAPDMLFHIPFEIPLVTYYLGQWFNLLPFAVIGLMLFQTKIFAPPATTPEAEQQQKIMKFMMVFMGVMFYKVPSGLGIYFITSSLWAIGERLLLPKVVPATPQEMAGKAASSEKSSFWTGRGSQNGDRGGGKNDADNSNGEKSKPPGALAQLWSRILEEARKDPTYRKIADDRDGDADRDRDRERERDRPRPNPRRR